MSSETTKADELALVLEEAILSGALEPGSVLRQEQLSEKFRVSRTPVREALRQLSATGLVSFTPNRGVRVRPVSREDLREAFLIRAELEGLAAELAAPSFSEPDLEALTGAELRFADLTHSLQASDRLSETERRQLTVQWFQANEAFHDQILRAAEAPLLERMARSVQRVFHAPTIWARSETVDQLYEDNLRQHRAIREAMAARSPAGARSLVREHIIAAGRLLEVLLADLEEKADHA